MTHENVTGPKDLSHLPLDNMAAVNRRYFHMRFGECKVLYFHKKSLKFVPEGAIDNNPELVRIMAWRRIGDKPLSEPMLTRFTDAYR